MTDVFVIAGPSAVGKTTLVHSLLAADSSLSYVRSMTTRPPRDAADGEYLYVSEDTFQRAQKEGELLESMRYGDYAYGTPRSEIDRIAREGKMPLLILDTVGVRSLKTLPDLRTFALYLYDDLNVMEQRLYDRELAAAPSVEALLTFSARKESNIRDYLTASEFLPSFDAVLKSTDLSELTERALSLLRDFLGEGTTVTDDERARVAAVLYEDAYQKTQYHTER